MLKLVKMTKQVKKTIGQLVQTETVAKKITDLVAAKRDIRNLDFRNVTVTPENRAQVIHLIDLQKADRLAHANAQDIEEERKRPIKGAVIAIKAVAHYFDFHGHEIERMMSTIKEDVIYVAPAQRDEFLERRLARLEGKYPANKAAARFERLVNMVITSSEELKARKDALRKKYADHPVIVDFRATRKTLARIL